MLTLQWGIVRCCRVLSVGSCIEMTAGIVQVGLQWAMFSIIQALSIIYYPPHLKFVTIPIPNENETSSDELELDNHDSRPSHQQRIIRTKVKTEDWKLSIILSWVVVVHVALIAFYTFFLLLTTAPEPSTQIPSSLNFFNQLVLSHIQPTTDLQLQRWAVFLGLSSAALAAIQYAPQIYHTYHAGLVGALSIPMMIIQTPGAGIMVISIALRPGTNWTSWIMFAVSGVMQGCLLVMCITWKLRQSKLGIDDFGRPLASSSAPPSKPSSSSSSSVRAAISDTPVLPAEEREIVSDALEDAVEEDVRSSGSGIQTPVAVAEVGGDETSPLLVKSHTGKEQKSGGWLGFLKR